MLFNIATIFTTAVLGLATQAAASPHHSSSMHRRGNGTNPWTISSFPTTDCSQTANNTQAAIGQVGCSGICNPLSSTFSSVRPEIVYGTWELELFTDMLCEVPAADYIVDAESTACGPVSLGSEGAGSFRMVLLGGLNDITCD